MALFLINGVLMDSTKEFELCCQTGLTVDVLYTEAAHSPNRVNNITEVHWRYEQGESVALESDLEQTGRTLELGKIEILSVKGQLLESDSLDELIDYWHTTQSEVALYDFLGVNRQQYKQWMERNLSQPV